MTVETVTYITDFNTAYPDGGDAKSEGDNHIRNIKTGIGGTFPNFTGIAMTATEAELNTLDGITATTTELNYADGPNTANKFCLLDGSADVPLAQIPDTLTGKDADSVDGYNILVGSYTINFASTAVNNIDASVQTLTGVSVGDPVFVTTTTLEPLVFGQLHAYASAADQVTVYYANLRSTTTDPGSITVKVLALT